MISKERLEELIEQGATIYAPDTMWQSVGEIKLNKNMKIKDGRLDGKLGDLGLKGAMCSCFIPLEDLVETKEEADWVVEFGDIVKTDKLDLEMWEKLKDCIYDNVFVVFDGELGEYVEYFMLVDKDIKILFRTLEHNMSTGYDIIFQEERTKENYTLACRKAKELFLGEKK